MGAVCTPTAPGCDFTDLACDPGGLAGDPTAEGCINSCVPVFDGETVPPDVLCPLDECDIEAFSIPGLDVFRCPSPTAAGDSFTCRGSRASPDPGRLGFCRAAGGLLDVCRPGVADQCESGTFCVDLGLDETGAARCGEEAASRRRLGVPADARGYCWTPAREGERCDSNLGRGAHGCAPCEWGTWCRDVGDPVGPVCMRACSTPSAPSVAAPGLCACSLDACVRYDDIAPADPEFPVIEGEPEVYCEQLLLPNGNRCDEQGAGVPCADESADCLETTQPVRGRIHICCRENGNTCTSSDDCCEGRSTCFEGVCTPCGRDNEAPTPAGCCPGHVIVHEDSGDDMCHSCAVSREGRDRALFGGASCEGEFVQLEDDAGQRDTIAVPVDGNAGAGPAELPMTSGSAVNVRYSLRDEHRLFLLEGDLTGEWEDRDPPGDPPDFLPSATAGWPPAGVTVGHRYLQLPANFPGISVRTVDLTSLTSPASTWQSLRVYDAGTCSQFIPYGSTVTPGLIDAIVASLNRFLVELSFDAIGTGYGATPLTLAATTYTPDVPPHITPILASGAGDFGRSIDTDQLNFFTEYEAVGGSALGCEGGRVRLSAGIRMVRTPAFAPTAAGEAEDRRLTREHDCDTPLPASCREQCFIQGDQYQCFGISSGVPPAISSRVLPRDVLILRDAFDFSPEIVFFDGGVVDCSAGGLNDLFTGILQAQIESKLDSILGQLTGSLTHNLTEWPNPADPSGARFQSTDLPSCGVLDAPTGELHPSDAACADALPRFFAGRRNSCVGFDDGGSRSDAPGEITSYRCARVRFEIRRMNLRPDGIEIVLADSAADPQHALFTTHPTPRVFDLCDPAREGSLQFDQVASPSLLTRASSALAAFGGRTICHPDFSIGPPPSGDPSLLVGCRGICSDTGTQCGVTPGPRGLGAAARRQRCYVLPNDTADERLPNRRHGQCCELARFCPVPPAGRGLPYFTTPPAGHTSTTWRCTDPDTDNFACGGCRITCTAPEQCCGGACRNLDTDRLSCGACGTVCPGGAPCLDGGCCGVGERICSPRGPGDPVCTDVTSNPFSCGERHRRCPTGNCSRGVCCGLGEIGCSGVCVDPESNDSNCGGCGVACSGGQHCSAGVCCAAGAEDCNGDGSCEDLSSNDAHCGACGNRCPFGTACSGRTCI